MEGYFEILRRTLDHGVRKPTRNGLDTLSLFGTQYEHDCSPINSFPMLLERPVPWKNVVIEVLWYLRGDTNVAYLQQHGVPIWDAWADSTGEVKAAYGRAFRAFPGTWGEETVDQVRDLIDGLKADPYGRRHVITAWHPELARVASPPPCACFQVYYVEPDPYRSRLHLHLTQRSADLAIGVPHNLATYALLLHIFARLSGLHPGRISHSLVDAHIYTTPLDARETSPYDLVPQVNELLRRCEARRRAGAVDMLPQLVLAPEVKTFEDLLALSERPFEEIREQIMLVDYKPMMPAIRMKAAI
jgi:thymidylate synthase